MKLRDEYADLEDLSASLDIEIDDLKAQLGEIGYQYDPVTNQFKL